MTALSLLQRFQALDSFLVQHQRLWRPRPFTHNRLPWETEHRALATWLRARSLEHAEAAHNQPHRLDQAPAPFPALAQQAHQLSQVAALPQREHPIPSPRLSLDVPGRKWQQVLAFRASLGFAQATPHWLDWCAGKGHLGRLLAQDGGQLTCLEHNPQLVLAGQALSQRQALNAQHLQQDVLAANAAQRLGPEHSPVALHACGDLHMRLIELASQAGCRQLAVAPCCYNRIATDHYQPLSATAQRSSLHLCRDDLGLPLSETVTAGARVRRQRNISMAWRLAFDRLQRELRGIDAYLPSPSLPTRWLHKSFPRYCQDLAALQGLKPNGATDWRRLEAHGWQRLAEVRNLELLRGLFRRPLEIWLLLDRALYLQDQGFHVQLGSFCQSSLTPRNLLLLAERT